MDNGLALTPPMGWNSWNQVRCYDLTEDVIVDMMEALIETGLADKGYEYVVIDDCWQKGRDPQTHRLQTVRECPRSGRLRFRHDISYLADLAHENGLKLGLYGVPGDSTCANYYDDYPVKELGSSTYEAIDAQTFAEWGVDYVKYDWCRADVTNGYDPIERFTLMRDELAKTGRPIVYAISEYGVYKPWEWGREVANLWRTTQDIQPLWASVYGIISTQDGLAKYGGPGHWNDPDMLQVGNGEFSPSHPFYLAANRSHFGMWCMLAAPLFLGTHVRNLPKEVIQIIGHEGVIAIDQDPLGVGASLVRGGIVGQADEEIPSKPAYECLADVEASARGIGPAMVGAIEEGPKVWARPLAQAAAALAVMNPSDNEVEAQINYEAVAKQLDLGPADSYKWMDLWADRELSADEIISLSFKLSPRDTLIFRLVPKSA